MMCCVRGGAGVGGGTCVWIVGNYMSSCCVEGLCIIFAVTCVLYLFSVIYDLLAWDDMVPYQ